MIEPNDIPSGPWKSAGEIIVASDPKAERMESYVRRNDAGNIELLSVREGPSGASATIREIHEKGPHWRYLAEGETQSELLASLEKRKSNLMPFSETMEDSIADVCAKHAVSSMRAFELRGTR